VYSQRQVSATISKSLYKFLDIRIKEAYDLGIRAIMFFGVPNDKDDIGSGAYDHNGVVQEATRISKNLYKDLLIVADTCLCEYNDVSSSFNLRNSCFYK
jgi:delta-aminolevulinic acid dehydratase/porphobilinogen synthase